MLVSTRRAPVQGIANEARAATVSRTNRNSLQSFADRFSAAVASTSAPKSATSANLGLERSNSASSRKQFLASAGGHRGDDEAGRNLLEIPMDQPPAVAPTANPATAATPKPPAYDGPQDLRDRISDAAGKVNWADSTFRGWHAIPRWDADGPGAFGRIFVRAGVRCLIEFEDDPGDDSDSTYVPSPLVAEQTACWSDTLGMTARDTAMISRTRD